MAVIPYTLVYTPNATVGGNDTLAVVWGPSAALAALYPQFPTLASQAPLTFSGLDSGAPVSLPSWADCSFQAVGTFGAGGAVVIEGSNDGAAYGTLNDPFAIPLSFTTAFPRTAVERCLFVRPHVIGGDLTTSLAVIALFRRQPITS
jgi:hypothetical protein